MTKQEFARRLDELLEEASEHEMPEDDVLDVIETRRCDLRELIASTG